MLIIFKISFVIIFFMKIKFFSYVFMYYFGDIVTLPFCALVFQKVYVPCLQIKDILYHGKEPIDPRAGNDSRNISSCHICQIKTKQTIVAFHAKTERIRFQPIQYCGGAVFYFIIHILKTQSAPFEFLAEIRRSKLH